MSTPAPLATFLLQLPVNATGTDVHLLTIFVGVIALFFFLVMVGGVIGAIYAIKTVKKVETKFDALEKKAEGIVAQVTAKTMPILDKAHEIIDDLQPKIRTISENAVAISHTARVKVDEIGETVTNVNRTVQDVNGKTQQQVQRVNGIVTDGLTAVQHLSTTVQHGIRVPINKVAGWIAAAKAGMQTLADRSPLGRKKADKGPSSPYDF